MSRVFGLEASHEAQNIVYRQNYYKTKPNYISEYDLILLIRNCFAHGFNPRCLLSFSTIKLNPIWTGKLLKDELREGMLAKLLIEQYDVSRSGKLNTTEYQCLLNDVQRELDAQRQLPLDGAFCVHDYFIGRTLGTGKTGATRAGI